MRELYGWRTNLENAVRRGDCDRVTQICANRPADHVSEYVNMRLLLRFMARVGQLDICKVLFTSAGANLDCVHSPNNKREWTSYQAESGNSGNAHQNFPLIEAAANSHAHVVEWLIKKVNILFKCHTKTQPKYFYNINTVTISSAYNQGAKLNLQNSGSALLCTMRSVKGLKILFFCC